MVLQVSYKAHLHLLRNAEVIRNNTNKAIWKTELFQKKKKNCTPHVEDIDIRFRDNWMFDCAPHPSHHFENN